MSGGERARASASLNDGDCGRARSAAAGPMPLAAASPPTGGRRPGAAPLRFLQRVDGVYVEWSVSEVDCGAVPGARRARCLLFARDSCIRRVWDYPANWRALDDTELAALSWRR